jgi:hypothetical protein
VSIETAGKDTYYHAGTSSKIYLTLLGTDDIPLTHETSLRGLQTAFKTGGKQTIFIGSEVKDTEVQCLKFRIGGSDGWIMKEVSDCQYLKWRPSIFV